MFARMLLFQLPFFPFSAFLIWCHILLDDLLSTAIIFFGARMFPSHPLAQFCKYKTIHFRQFFLEIPLPFVPNSVLCPLIALSRYLRSVPAPLFVLSQGASLRPTLAAHFNRFFKACVVSVGLNPGFFLSRSFRATFASNCVASTELIKAQGISEAAPV